MKKLLLLIIFITHFCLGQTKKQTDMCWNGTINNKIPVFIHYSLENDLVIGEITYTKTKEKKPIKLIGEYFTDNDSQDPESLRLVEYDKNGNVTGIIVVTPNKKELNGKWFSPNTNQEYSLKATKNDTLQIYSNHKANPNDIYGEYSYSYGKFAYKGDLAIKKDVNNISFNILALGKGDGPNISQIEDATINKITNNSFIYKIPDTENCSIKVTFYKDFVSVKRLERDCEEVFAMGTYVDEVYIKTK
ncbi:MULTISPECIES: hypothetical protein [Flavobacterium]|uniref:hypothetical protein n=1 Tax=Flavobacterium TaxID=237 RepID=UPI001FCBA7F2|nr:MULTISPECIES: hypothetical protein [Flavobacterium]UOK42231.1 hypothetical protein LZF87_13045 [Flavobacterium enshiense]